MEVEESAADMTDYVATRWYRAPELLLEHKDYTPAVDMWSVGCILAELIKRKPFLPGVDSRNQLELIIDLVGTPPESEVEKIPKEKIKKLIRLMPKKSPKDLGKMFPSANPLSSSPMIPCLDNLLRF
jgi:serine/threonine protein kinase